MGLWLMGRTQPLVILGLSVTLDKIHALMNLFEWKEWPGFYPVIIRAGAVHRGLDDPRDV